MGAKLKDQLGFGVSESETEVAVRLGGGFDYYWTENHVIEFELGGVIPSGDLKDGDVFTFVVGYQYRF